MQNPIETTATCMGGLSQQFRTIAHNLANANTVGYKRRRNAFSLSLAVQMEALPGVPAEANSSAAGQITATTSVDFTQGAFVRTGRPLDLALDGPGFFVIETPEGPRYSRNGTLRVSPTGQLVDGGGRAVAGEGGPITIPNTVSSQSVQVGRDGSVSAGGGSIGQLRLVEFEDTSVLEPVGASCFRAPATVGPRPATNTAVRQGHQESSNVNVVEELVGLITVSRFYEANLKSVVTQDERLKSILQVAMS